MPEATHARTAVDVVAAIEHKRDGAALDDATIDGLINGYVAGDVPDYQMAALLMAIVWRGMTPAETAHLTQAMVASGDTVDLSPLGRRIVDKHSTGGVGDKVSIALGPAVAACGVPFAKMSGRGLGHTGGTLDKLESIPGFSVELSYDAFLAQVQSIGIAIIGQTADIVPADKLLYALRDVTGTVESMPLIAASIMSKKLAAGADAIVLDVKVGSGAFMKHLDDARALAQAMISIGTHAGREVKALLTDMEAPLGRAVGNALEIREVIDLLDGNGPAELRELIITGGGELLSLSDLDISEEEGQERVAEVLSNGAARERFNAWVEAQGGDPHAPLPTAPVQRTVAASIAGTITAIDALTVGRATVHLGAGRATKDSAIRHDVGVVLAHTVGERVSAGDDLFTVHAATDADADTASDAILAAFTIDPAAAPSARSVILERV